MEESFLKNKVKYKGINRMNILSIGEKIKKRRKYLGMTLKDLAGNRITTGQLSLIESGKSNPSIELLEYLSKKLNTTSEHLLESKENQVIKICKYYENMAICYLFERNISEVEKYISKMISISNQYNIPQIEYRIYFLRAMCYYKSKNYESATENFLVAHEGFLELSMYDEFVESLLYLSYISIEQGNYISGIIHLECIIQIIGDHFSGNNLLFFEVYYLISRNYILMGNISKGEYYLDKSIEILNKIYNPRSSALHLMERAIECIENDNIDEAIKFSEISRINFYGFISLRKMQKVELEISKYLIDKSDVLRGEKHLIKARSINTLYNFKDLFKIYKNFVELYIKKDSLNKAKYYLTRLEELENLNNYNDILELCILKYKIYIYEKNYCLAGAVLILAYNFSRYFGEHTKAGDFCFELSKVYLNIGKIQECKNTLQEALIQYKKGECKFNL